MTDKRAHRRVHRLVSLKLSDIHLDQEYISDDYFMEKLLLPYIQGTKNAFITRVDSSRILNGFIANGAVQSNAEIDKMERIIIGIKMGGRPTVDIYRNHNQKGLPEFSCGDFENALAAYKKLNFEFIPCLVHGGKKGLNEAYFETKGDLHDFRVIAGNRVQPKDLLAFNIESTNFFPAIIYRFECLEQAMAQFFVQKDGGESGYNDVLSDIVRQAKEFLLCLAWAFESKFYSVCCVVVRSLYEMLINFYIDWLSPDHFGGALQLASAVGGSTERKRIVERHPRAAEMLSDFVNVCGSVEKKSRLSPLGSFFYERFYRTLSAVAHQDYSFREVTIGGENFLERKDLLNATSIICAALLQRVACDIGVSIGTLKPV